MKKSYLVGIGAVVVAVALVALLGGATVISADTTKTGDFGAGEKITIANGATLTVDGNLTVDKKFDCKNGPLSLVVNGDATITGTLECELAETVAELANGITLVVTGSLTFGKDAQVVSNGHVQIVSDAADLLTTQEAIDAAYEEAGQPTGSGPRVGPFIGDGNVTVTPSEKSADRVLIQRTVITQAPLFINTAHAQAPTDKDGNVVENVVIGGNWYIGDRGLPPTGLQVPTPPKGVNKIILNFNFGPGRNVHLVDFHLVGPDGANGTDDDGVSCNARGGDGKDAMRLRVRAGTVTVNNFRIEMGDGGAGGIAVTKKDCDPGVARGGNGGEAGNIKITADQGITITSMHISPGVGGQGGPATAYGKDGKDACPGEKGGDATATGGKGGDNKKELSAAGAVDGIGNITLDEVTGGIGGQAIALPGKGGNGTGCNCNGGQGGKATATAGDGGKASLQVVRGGPAADATGGAGGDAEATGAAGGNGGACPLKPKGGNGGNGGDAKGTEGKGGTGTTAKGDDGTVQVEKGGNGGNGGDGCGPGNGGKGGKAREPGVDGQPGKLICPEEEKKKETQVDPGQGGDKVMIEVINYNGKYLPVSQLIIEDEIGCGADHWHAATGVVTATDGTQVSDPGPQCGYGKVKDKPVIKVEAQAAGAVQAQNDPQAQIKSDVSLVVFYHYIGKTQCPTPVEPITFSGKAVTKWRVYALLPSWLQANTSGDLASPFQAQFTCQLDSYETQTLNTTLAVEGLDASGKVVATTQVKIAGKIIK